MTLAALFASGYTANTSNFIPKIDMKQIAYQQLAYKSAANKNPTRCLKIRALANGNAVFTQNARPNRDTIINKGVGPKLTQSSSKTSKNAVSSVTQVDTTSDVEFAIDTTYRPDSLIVADTTVLADSLHDEEKSMIDAPIFTDAEDSTIYLLDDENVVLLYGNAVVIYDNLELRAAFIQFDSKTKLAFAKGMPDSTGQIVGRPIFKEGSNTYEMDDILYNFDTKRAKINGVVTEQQGGYLHSEVLKKTADNEFNLKKGKYTTCDAKDPHFYINISKGKMIPNEKIVSGVANFVLLDVPLPIGLPFGFFPISKEREGGIIIPEYRDEQNRGIGLSGGGVYFGIGDYFDEKLTFDFYSRGSWGVQSNTNYRLRYKFSGNLGFKYSLYITGEEGLKDYRRMPSYSIVWSHRQDSKANPTATFSANVNINSVNYNMLNATSIRQAMANTTTSSVSYSKNWPGSPFSLTASLRHTLSTKDSTIDVQFPQLSFNMSTIYPFKRKVPVGKPKWYEKISIALRTNVTNNMSAKEKDFFSRQTLMRMKNGMKHDIPISTSFNLFNFINIAPSISYSEYWYMNTIEKYWNADPVSPHVVEDTIQGFKRAYQYSGGVSLNTKIYGMFQFSKKSKIQAIRHIITPSIAYSFRPDFGDPKYGFYKEVQVDTSGRKQQYSIFANSVYGGPGRGKSGTISIGISNNLEMKVLSKDTTNPVKKIRILDGLSFNTSYNTLVDSMNWSDLRVSGRTTLFEGFSVNFGGTFSPYAINERGTKIKDFEFRKTGKLARFTNASLSFSFSLNSKKKDSGNRNMGAGGVRGVGSTRTNNGEDNPPGTAPDGSQFGESFGTHYGMDYVDFDMPWDINVSYNLSYSKPAHTPNLTQSVTVNGNLSLTPKWKIGFSSGFDLKNMKITTSSVNFYRDLHCWEMRLSVVPFGRYRSYSFQINVKSSMLRDLKIKKNESYLDNIN